MWQVAWITWDGLEWDVYFTSVFTEWHQFKNQKSKLAVFSEGKDKDSSWFLALGDYLTLMKTPLADVEGDTQALTPQLSTTALTPQLSHHNPHTTALYHSSHTTAALTPQLSHHSSHTTALTPHHKHMLLMSVLTDLACRSTMLAHQGVAKDRGTRYHSEWLGEGSVQG